MIDRRKWALGSVALASAAGGLGWALLGDRAESNTLWSMRFPTPQGGELRMSELRGRPLIVNFWATWCPPCVREMPTLDAFQRRWAGRGWQVLGLALDNAQAVREFLGRTPVSFHIALAGMAGTELSRQLGNRTAALPFTVVLDAQGIVRHRKHGETQESELEAWARSITP